MLKDYKAETSWLSCGFVHHDDSISDAAVSTKVIRQHLQRTVMRDATHKDLLPVGALGHSHPRHRLLHDVSSHGTRAHGAHGTHGTHATPWSPAWLGPWVRRIQRLAAPGDVGSLQLSRLRVAVHHIKSHGVSGNGLATNAVLDVEEHLFAVLHVDKAIALWPKALHRARVHSSALNWTSEGRAPSCRLRHAGATLDVLGLKLFRVLPSRLVLEGQNVANLRHLARLTLRLVHKESDPTHVDEAKALPSEIGASARALWQGCRHCAGRACDP
mmetsp:Transcript_48490/g.77104  ORF Transcript_48490/g.77104 Transcript_48490/m.77104 type:complete len:272 (+) Transcript_48490:27-842(+)